MQDNKIPEKRVCKKCLQEDYRILAGKWGKDKKYVNLEGKNWNGNTCPKCNVVRVRYKIRELRDNRKESSGNGTNPAE